MNKKVIAYKAFDKDLKCRGVQYEVGHTFYEDCEKLVPCESGIHCCLKLKDVYNYYRANESTRICEVEVIGEHIVKSDKLCCREIFIARELSIEEIKSLTDDFKFNSGDWNSGNRNSGNYNSGHRNSGDWNSGHRNGGHYNSGDYSSGDWNSGNYNSGHRNSGDWSSGDRNSGDWNSGHYNSGHRNSGNRNSGHWNSGNRNSGHRNGGNWNSGNCNSGNWNSGNGNSGDWNSGDWNSGYFNSRNNDVWIFNTLISQDEVKPFVDSINSILSKYWKPHLAWVYSSNMTEKEKQDNPSHETTGGYLKKTKTSYKKSWGHVWEQCTKEERQAFLDLPHFDAEVFKDITGINVNE